MMDDDDNDELPPPKVTDAPAAIWLVYGDIERDCTHWECARNGDVGWCEDKQFDSDVEYVRADTIVAAEVAKERERIRAAIMAKHEAANGQHNLYHCLAVELFGDEAIRAAAPPQCTSAPSEPQ